MAARTTTILTLIFTTSVAAASACDDTRTCQDIGCRPTYGMFIESPEPDLEPGLWRVDLQIDGAMVSAECMVSGPHEGMNMPCELGPWTDQPGRPLDLSVNVGTRIVEQGSGEPTDTGDPPEYSNQGIRVTAFSNDQEAPLETIAVAIFFEDALVLEEQRSPTYEVVEDYGGPGCGSCVRVMDDVLVLP